MKLSDVLQIIIFIVALVGLSIPVSAFMAQVFQGQKTFLHPILGWLEKLTYKVAGVNPEQEMGCDPV